ncbi:uncharacterized protein LOC112601479 [Melanaphis sacchari]|uniref:uncharacterized protein LOC112601479 n=1 Tax=Melanaphis sacchari TaxID=742174 RepID=UPI000DC13228|nr:uncharacterized protein LOC112601479 [Melanaphis sacchari]
MNYKHSDQVKNNKSWIINCFSKLSSNSEHISSIPMRVDFLNHSLNILADKVNEFIYLTPETYVMHLTLNLGILSFDSCHHGKWVLSFSDEESVMDCIKTLRKNDIKVTDIQKFMSERMHLEEVINKTVTMEGFPHFVAEVENAIKTKLFDY